MRLPYLPPYALRTASKHILIPSTALRRVVRVRRGRAAVAPLKAACRPLFPASLVLRYGSVHVRGCVSRACYVCALDGFEAFVDSFGGYPACCRGGRGERQLRSSRLCCCVCVPPAYSGIRWRARYVCAPDGTTLPAEVPPITPAVPCWQSEQHHSVHRTASDRFLIPPVALRRVTGGGRGEPFFDSADGYSVCCEGGGREEPQLRSSKPPCCVSLHSVSLILRFGSVHVRGCVSRARPVCVPDGIELFFDFAGGSPMCFGARSGVLRVVVAVTAI